MTKAEAIKNLLHLKEEMKNETFSFSWDGEFDALIEFIQSLPDVIQCKHCKNYNPNLKYCNYWDCTMYENAYCDQGERKNGEQ